MYRAKVSKWGNSQGIRIPAEVMRQKNMCIGDEVQIDTSQPDAIVITVSKSEKKQLRAAGMLSGYAKRKPDLNAERKAFENAVVEKYRKKGM